MRTNQRLVATIVTAAAFAAPAAASAMPAPPPSAGTAMTPPAFHVSGTTDRVAPRDLVASGVGTVTVLLLTGGSLAAGLAGGVGGSRLRRRHSLA
jgi:hypothetical protein